EALEVALVGDRQQHVYGRHDAGSALRYQLGAKLSLPLVLLGLAEDDQLVTEVNVIVVAVEHEDGVGGGGVIVTQGILQVETAKCGVAALEVADHYAPNRHVTLDGCFIAGALDGGDRGRGQ